MRKLVTIVFIVAYHAVLSQLMNETKWIDCDVPDRYRKVERGIWNFDQDSASVINFPAIELGQKDKWIFVPSTTLNSEGRVFIPPNPSFKFEDYQIIGLEFKELDSVNFSVQSFIASNNFVSNKDYQLFQKWVSDSIQLTKAGKLNKIDDYTTCVDWKKLNQITPQNFPDDSLNYEYWWIDFKSARNSSRLINDSLNTEASDPPNSGSFIKRAVFNVFPTIDWSFIENDTIRQLFERNYTSHHFFGNYPVLGLDAIQINGYLFWCTQQVNFRRRSKNKMIKNDIRLGTPWELMLLPKKSGRSEKLRILVDDAFLKAFGEGPWKKGEYLEVDYPTKPFRLVQTYTSQRKRRF